MKKMLIYLGIIVVIFAALFVVNKQSEKVNADNPYGVNPSQLNPATRQQLSDPNYQNIILPDSLDKKIANKEEVLVYFFQPTCPHCLATTPVINPMVKDLGVDLKQLNLLEYVKGWDKYKITGTPTIVYYKDGKEAARLENGVATTEAPGGNKPEDFKRFFETYGKKQ
ncbi:thioredoxin family protein [Paenibacillus sp. y28]|uniref:thioredoxin family protein n=1 Tax=Paenibacillus sp. y28 TaxID=3129110 RepID=UPI003017A11E